MFGKQALGYPFHLCLRQLCFRMPNDMIIKLCIVFRKEDKRSILPSDGGEAMYVGVSVFVADPMVKAWPEEL